MNAINRLRSVLFGSGLRIVILAALAGSGCRPVPGLSNDVYVAVDGDDARNCFTPAAACATIGRALAQVNRGGIIHLSPGDHVPSEAIVISKLVILEGEGRGVTNLYPVSSPAATESLQIPDRSGLVMRNLTFSGARLGDLGDRLFFGIQTGGQALLDIQNVEIVDFATRNIAAIRNAGGTLLVSDSLFSRNRRAIAHNSIEPNRATISSTEFVSNGIAVENTGPMTMSDVTFTGNGVTDNFAALTNDNQGALRITNAVFQDNLGTAILNSGRAPDLTLIEVRITGSGGAGLEMNGGQVSLSRVLIQGSRAQGILMTAGTLEVERATLAENGADGIEVRGGTSVTLTNVVIRDHPGNGLISEASATTVDVVRSAIIRNGLNGLAAEGSTVGVDTSTVSGNDTGIWMDAGSLNLSDSTIALNENFGVDALPGARIRVNRSLVALNLGPADCSHSETLGPPRSSVWCDNTLTQAELGLGDLIEENLTFVHPILDNSSPLNNAAGGDCPDLDQRQADRPAFIFCDIGAYELQPAVTSLEGTPIALATVTPEAALEVTFVKTAFCRVGPSTYYNIQTAFDLGAVSPIRGKNEDASWWLITDPESPQACWVSATTVETSASPDGIELVGAPPLPDPVEGFYLDDFDCDVGNKKYMLSLWWLDGEGEQGYRLYRNGDEMRPLRQNSDHFNDDEAPLFEELLYELEAYNEYGASERRYVEAPACQ